MSDTELVHERKTETETVRRLEVFTGAGRRRAWTAEQKAEIVAESHAGGVTVSAVARRHGLTPQQLFAWRRHAGRPGEGGGLGGRLSFAPVVVTTPAIEVVIGALHRLRRLANAILHLDAHKDEGLPKIESAQMEKEIVSLLFVLRALIEGAPQWRPR